MSNIPDDATPDVKPFDPPLPAAVEALERKLLRRALRLCRGNLTAAGRVLGLSFRQVRYLVSKYGR